MVKLSEFIYGAPSCIELLILLFTQQFAQEVLVFLRVFMCVCGWVYEGGSRYVLKGAWGGGWGVCVCCLLDAGRHLLAS